jgi:hypothetical protein
MNYLIIFLFLGLTQAAKADDFPREAKQLATDLRTSLMKTVSEKVAKEGVVQAVPFCHANVKGLAKSAAGERLKQYEFGRTSHRVRNQENRPAEWMRPYLEEFQGSSKGDGKREFIIHKLPDSKRVYLEPLYVEAKCLLCHGENVSKDVKQKIDSLYPGDQATGFKAGEFRGFIWVKEK